MKERSQNIDAIRGIAAILVMFGHCIVLNGMQDGLIYDMIKSVQMPLFMLVSGYLVSLTGKIDSFWELERLIIKRAAVCLLPFFVWILVLHPFSFLKSLKETLFQIDKGLWFLMVLFLFSMVQSLAGYTRTVLVKKKGPAVGWIGFFAVWSLFGLILLLQIISANHFLSPHLSIYYLPFYLGGYLFGICYIFVPERVKNKCRKFTIPCMVLALFLLFSISLGFDMIIAADKKVLLLQFFASVMGSIGVILLITKIKGKSKALLSFVGQYTLEIYVIHYHFARILWRGTVPVTELGFTWCYRVLLSWMLMSILTAAVIYVLKKIKIADILLFGQYYKYK